MTNYFPLEQTSFGARSKELTLEQIDRYEAVRDQKTVYQFLSDPFEADMTEIIMNLNRAHMIRIKARDMFPDQ